MDLQNAKFDPKLYQKLPQIVLGFHGCDQSVAEKVLNSSEEHLIPSENDYDWLGDGIYFWLNDPQRAYEWACQTNKRNPNKVKNPYVIGAVIDLGLCLNFCERESILLLQKSYEMLNESFRTLGLDLHTQKKNKAPDKGGFNLIRPLDCAVIKNLHAMVAEKDISFDTVYGYFQEGEDAFLNAGIKEKSHVQVCVRNTNCIKGYFLPRLK